MQTIIKIINVYDKNQVYLPGRVLELCVSVNRGTFSGFICLNMTVWGGKKVKLYRIKLKSAACGFRPEGEAPGNCCCASWEPHKFVSEKLRGANNWRFDAAVWLPRFAPCANHRRKCKTTCGHGAPSCCAKSAKSSDKTAERKETNEKWFWCSDVSISCWWNASALHQPELADPPTFPSAAGTGRLSNSLEGPCAQSLSWSSASRCVFLHSKGCCSRGVQV